MTAWSSTCSPTCSPDDPGLVSLDMFRLEDGRIVEHWDVIQEVPAESANANGMW